MTQSLAISVAALLSLLPVSLQAYRSAAPSVATSSDAVGSKVERLSGEPGPSARFWLLLGVAVLGSLAQVAQILSGGWQPGVGAAIWISIAATLFVFAGVALLLEGIWRLTPLLGTYLFLLGLTALFLPDGEAYAGVFDFWLVLHVIVSLAAYALLTLGAVAALGVFLQERALKLKSRGRISRSLPSVTGGENIVLTVLLTAVLVLGLGIVTGMAELYVNTGSLLVFNHKILLSILGFVATLGLLVLHQRIGLRGRKAARLVLLAFLLVTLGYPGVKFVTDVILQA